MGNRMTALVINGDTSGSITLQVPAAAGSGTVHTLPAATGTVMVSGNMPAFSAYQSSNQTLTNATWTKIQYQTKEFDTANCFDNTTNYRFTPNVAGYYQINGSIFSNWTGSQFSSYSLSIYKNGSQYKTTQILPSSSSVWYGNVTVQDIVFLNGSTDYIEIYQNVTTGSGTPVTGGGQSFTWVTGAMVRSA